MLDLKADGLVVGATVCTDLEGDKVGHKEGFTVGQAVNCLMVGMIVIGTLVVFKVGKRLDGN